MTSRRTRYVPASTSRRGSYTPMHSRSSGGHAAIRTHTPAALCRQTMCIANEENRCKTREKEYPAHVGHLHTCRRTPAVRTNTITYLMQELGDWFQYAPVATVNGVNSLGCGECLPPVAVFT